MSGSGRVAHAERAGAPAIANALDLLIDRYCGGEFADEVKRARADYDSRRGLVYEDEDLYEAWTVAFLEWYVCEHNPAGADLPPAGLALRAEPQAADSAVLRALVTSHRSLFEVKRIASGRVFLGDLIGGADFAVVEPRAMHGVSKGDVVEARLVGLDGEVLFARTSIYHPSETRTPIEDHVHRLREAGVSRQEIIDFIARLRVRCERYRHLSPDKMYAAGEPADGAAPK